MAEKDRSKKEKTDSIPKGGDIHVGGNVEKSVLIDGDNNVVYYYAGGEKREMRTGWFYGHRYGDLAAFTGRADELKMLDDWLANDTDNLLLMTAFGGFGKSALTWQWFNNRVDKSKWQTAVWWSFYEKESGFESFLAETLNHLGVEVKQSARLQLNDLLEAMRGTNILVVLDGFERLLRQYGRMDAALQPDDEDADIDPSQRDCSSPLTETFLRGLSGAGLKSKVLLTTRLCPRALESADGKLLKGCREEPLAAFAPEDAVTYFHNEGVKATRAEVIEACAAYGYHPLSLSLLVGLINEDHEKRGDIEAVKNLQIFEDVKARRHHVLERACGSLAHERRDLLSKMSCFRGSMEYAVLKKVFPSPDLDKSLLDLRKRGLLQYADVTQRYDMHPVVRHYAYAHLTDTERISTHNLLIDFFEALPIPQKIVRIEDLDPVIEQYFHTVRAGMFDKALNIFANHLSDSLYFHFGVYTTIIQLLRELFRNDKETSSLLLLEDNCAWASSVIATSYCLSGQPRRAIPFFKVHNKSRKKFHRVRDYAVGLENMALVAQISIGNLRQAEKNLFTSIELRKDLPNQKIWIGVSYRELGRIMLYRGVWDDAKQNLDIAYKLFSKGKLTQSKSAVQAYRALHILMKYRDNIPSKRNVTLAIRYAKSSLEIAKEMEKAKNPFPRDLIFANLVLGSAYLLSNQIGLAEDHFVESLTRCRVINLVEMEASILLDVARLRYAQGDFKDAQEKASEALVITERSGYVLQGADVHLFLAELAMNGHRSKVEGQLSDKEAARKHAEEALRLATCDGPPYYYKVAYEEAERMLERLKEEG